MMSGSSAEFVIDGTYFADSSSSAASHAYQQLLCTSRFSRRYRRPGPEKNLVDWFLAACPFASSKGLQLTIFEEPRLESGFPDLVLVIWDDAVTASWSSERRQLTPEHLRLLHTLTDIGPASESRLSSLFQKAVSKDLALLERAQVAANRDGLWCAGALNEIYAVKEIIAIEAKVDAVSSGLEQSALNRWFASTSYLLLPQAPGTDLAARAVDLGVGILTRNGGIITTPPSNTRSPQSYASWLFNEWVWKGEALKQEKHPGASVGHNLVSFSVPEPVTT